MFMGGIDYQLNFNEENSSFIACFAGQTTGRKHYTGTIPDSMPDIAEHMVNPPYGTTTNITLQAGTQISHRIQDFIGGKNVVTAGIEAVYDNVLDSIPTYNNGIDQMTLNMGAFLQSDWEITPELNYLAGLRGDKHNFVDKLIVSPRLSFLSGFK